MKKFCFALLAVLIFLSFSSCSKKKEELQKWEYKTIRIEGVEYSDFAPRAHYTNELIQNLDTLGLAGWELIEVIPFIETVHPNFGNEKYVTGLQANTRTEGYTCIFKRPLQESVKSSTIEAEEDSVVEDTVAEELLL